MNAVPAGVVLDKPLAEALLFAAVRERLVADEPSIGDGFVARLLHHPPEEELIQAAFEQLVLGGVAFVPFWLPPAWPGELFEDRTVSRIPSESEDAVAEVSALPASVLLGMMKARGIVWGANELAQRYELFMDSYRAWERLADGKSFDGIEIRMALRGITNDALDDYTQEQIAAWARLQGEYRHLKPVLDCFEAYSKIIGASMAANALSSVPVVPSALTLHEPISVPAGTERLQLFRITCKALRRVPVATTLRETLKIARSEEAIALRSRLAQWADASREQDIDAAELAIADVEYARQALAGARRAARIGEYATWISLPVSIAGAFIAGPVLAEAGIAISAAGFIAVATQKSVELMNRWAMFCGE